ncbi:hypothetical protein FOZ63_006516, partial [Perkinsus olseni]
MSALPVRVAHAWAIVWLDFYQTPCLITESFTDGIKGMFREIGRGKQEYPFNPLNPANATTNRLGRKKKYCNDKDSFRFGVYEELLSVAFILLHPAGMDCLLMAIRSQFFQNTKVNLIAMSMAAAPFFERLAERCRAKDSLLCVGLDPHVSELPEPTPEAAFKFCEELVEATKDVAVAYKPNAAFFEQFGAAGWEQLKRLIEHIRRSTDGAALV